MIVNQGFTTVSCDNAGCEKHVTFEAKNEGLDPKVLEAEPWLKTNLVVRLTDNRTFSVCSTICLVEAAGKGLFDPIEPKQIAQATGAAAIAQAAAEARRRQLADENMREGKPVTLATS